MARPKGDVETFPLHTRLTGPQLAGFREYLRRQQAQIQHTGLKLTDAAVLRGMVVRCLDLEDIAHKPPQQELAFSAASPVAPPPTPLTPPLTPPPAASPAPPPAAPPAPPAGSTETPDTATSTERPSTPKPSTPKTTAAKLPSTNRTVTKPSKKPTSKAKTPGTKGKPTKKGGRR